MDDSEIQARVDALMTALDRNLAAQDSFQWPRVKKAKKATAAQAHDTKLETKHLALVLRALADAAWEAGGSEPHEIGLRWYKLKACTKLDDDLLGLALSELIPKRVRSRDEGDGRFYFLPAPEINDLFRRRAALRSQAA